MEVGIDFFEMKDRLSLRNSEGETSREKEEEERTKRHFAGNTSITEKPDLSIYKVTQLRVDSQVHVCILLRIYMYMCVRIYTHMHIHTRKRSSQPSRMTGTRTHSLSVRCITTSPGYIGEMRGERRRSLEAFLFGGARTKKTKQ